MKQKTERISVMNILFQDHQLLLCVKPAGMPSQPDPSGQPDLLSKLQENFSYVGLVHRLDTPTGGLMLYSLSQKMTGKLSVLVQDHEAFMKEYYAVLPKAPDSSSGELTDFLFHDRRKNKAYAAAKKRAGCKEAKLSYQTLQLSEDGHALVKVRLYTGRTHQIRVQFGSRGLPLIGDGKYGSREKAKCFALWSCHLSFVHPVTGKKIEAVCRPDTAEFPWNLFDWENLSE